MKGLEAHSSSSNRGKSSSKQGHHGKKGRDGVVSGTRGGEAEEIPGVTLLLLPKRLVFDFDPKRDCHEDRIIGGVGGGGGPRVMTVSLAQLRLLLETLLLVWDYSPVDAEETTVDNTRTGSSHNASSNSCNASSSSTAVTSSSSCSASSSPAGASSSSCNASSSPAGVSGSSCSGSSSSCCASSSSCSGSSSTAGSSRCSCQLPESHNSSTKTSSSTNRSTSSCVDMNSSVNTNSTGTDKDSMSTTGSRGSSSGGILPHHVQWNLLLLFSVLLQSAPAGVRYGLMQGSGSSLLQLLYHVLLQEKRPGEKTHSTGVKDFGMQKQGAPSTEQLSWIVVRDNEDAAQDEQQQQGQRNQRDADGRDQRKGGKGQGHSKQQQQQKGQERGVTRQLRIAGKAIEQCSSNRVVLMLLQQLLLEAEGGGPLGVKEEEAKGQDSGVLYAGAGEGS